MEELDVPNEYKLVISQINVISYLDVYILLFFQGLVMMPLDTKTRSQNLNAESGDSQSQAISMLEVSPKGQIRKKHPIVLTFPS